ncbi:AAA family ATPase [Dactylosporangium sp. NPDC050588]|uniref:ATP-binding protein n=1 Tax=Dactylosporangium sp. NPDC050588 TaxID=3157211 RepID=UPI0033FAC041
MAETTTETTGDLDPARIAAVDTLAGLARLLRELRRREARRQGERELTYRELAAATGWSSSVIGAYLTGETLPPTNRFDALIQALGAGPAEQRLLATARDRVEERPRGGGKGTVRLGGPALVGRSAELAVLRAAVDATVRGGGGAVFLVGDAGIGKTRLATEAARCAEAAGLRVLKGRAVSPAMQFRPLREAVLPVLRHDGPPDDPMLVPYHAALSRLVPEWRTDRPDGADGSLVVLAEAVLRLAVTIGRPRGCLLLLEDLHEADPETLAVVDYLVDNVAAEHLLILGTTRPAPGSAVELFRAARQRRSADLVALGRLDEEAVRLLAGACLDAPDEEVPAAVLARLATIADGVPLHVEELLAGMVGDGVLVHDDGGWTLSGPVDATLPATLATTLAGRVERLSGPARAMLHAAALLGRRFRAETAGAIADVAGLALVACLREAVGAQLLVPDEDDPAQYHFRHMLTAEVLRAQLLPVERALLSGRAAAAVEAAAPDGWPLLAAELWSAAGEPLKAATRFATAGRQATAEGALSTGIALLERALSLAGTGGSGPRPEIVVALVDGYADAGRIEDAHAVAARFSGHAEIHLRLARVAAAAGDWLPGLEQVAVVRDLLGPDPDPAVAARVDEVEARLAFGNPTADRRASARELAQRALDAAGATGQPDVAVGALETLGRCARLHDMAEADELYRRGLALADEHGLAARRIGLLYNIGAHDGIRDGDVDRLVEALAVARDAGAVVTALDIEIELCMARICRGEYAQVQVAARRCEETAARLRLTHSRLIALGVRIMAAAHRAERREVDTLMARFRDLGGEEDDFSAAVHGVGLAFGHLLYEEHDLARDELARSVAQESHQPTSYVSFINAPHLLLSVRDGTAGRAECAAFAASPQAEAGWNRQFLHLAEALAAARAGAPAEAAASMATFLASSERFPMARFLGLRLVADDAVERGWGEPVAWLRTAEAHFHDSAPHVARACRDLLRRAGAPVPQHRQGSAVLPPTARELGITVREFEVLALVGEQLSNAEIGRRLFLSPRTVEKHVGNLLAKTGLPDRGRLAGFAAEAETGTEHG